MKLTRDGLVIYPSEACKGFEEKILLMQSGGLSDAEEKLLMDHVETCEGCKTLFQHYELIDKGIREVLLARQEHPVKEMPKKLQIMLSEASKRHLAISLQELGQSILFQKPKVCDLIRPWSEPQPIDHCITMLNNSFTSVLHEPLMQEAGLKPEFVEDCRQFLHGLVDNPNRFMNVENAKEALDRSLAVEPDHVLTIKSLADYYHCRSDHLSTSNEYLRLLNLKLDANQKYRASLNASSHLMHINKYTEANEQLTNAESLNSDFLLYFLKFKFILFEIHNAKSDVLIQSAIDNMIRMDDLIKSSSINIDSVSLIAKWIATNKHTINRLTRNNRTISNLSTKYSDIILCN